MSRKSLYEPSGMFLLRTPTMSWEFYKTLTERNVSDLRQDFAQSSSSFVSGNLYAFNIKNAILISSLGFFENLSKNEIKAKKKLLSYLIRMSTRCTPFGMFAGVSLGAFGSKTKLTFDYRKIKIRARPDMGWFFSLVFKLESNPNICKNLEIIANQSLIEHGGRIFSLEDLTFSSTMNMQKVSIRSTNAIKKLMALSKHGIKQEELIATLQEDYVVERDKVEGLISNLISKSILITNLRPPPTNPDQLSYVTNLLKDSQETTAAKLNVLKGTLSQLETTKPQQFEKVYYDALQQINWMTEKKNNSPLQIDAAFEYDNLTLPSVVGTEAAKAAELLLSISPFPNGLPYMRLFKQKFKEKYGELREVFLLEVIDPNAGIGSPYISHYEQTAPELSYAEKEARQKRDQVLTSLAYNALLHHQLSIQLNEPTISALKTCSPSVSSAPASLDLFLSVASESSDAIDKGDFKIILSPITGVVGAGNGIGRFSDILGGICVKFLKEIIKKESELQKGKLIAEIVTLPRNVRTTDVAIRNAICDYEIVLGVTPSVKKENTIPLNEIVIALKDDRFYIRWQTKNKEIQVRSSSMLNPNLIPDSLHLLLDISMSNIIPLSNFFWGTAENAPFLPRVEAGKTVLRPAQWLLDPRNMPKELELSSIESFSKSIRTWRKIWNVPRYIYFGQADNRLLLDLDSRVCTDQFYEELRHKKSDRVLLQEALTHGKEMIVEVEGKHYFNEMVIPLLLNDGNNAAGEFKQAPSAQETRNISSVSDQFRNKPLGTDWLFAKFYIYKELEDDVLSGTLHKLIQEATDSGIAKSWFFMRYADPEEHIRLRFNGDGKELMGKLLPRLCEFGENLIREGFCNKFALDTYEREVERYGGEEGIILAEKLFSADSELASDLLGAIQNNLLKMDKVLLAALTAECMLKELGIVLSKRAEMYAVWAQKLRSNFKKGEFKDKLNALYLYLSNLDETRSKNEGDLLSAELDKMGRNLAEVGSKLMKLEASQQLTSSLINICDSYIHMHCNRLLGLNTNDEASVRILLKRVSEMLLNRNKTEKSSL